MVQELKPGKFIGRGTKIGKNVNIGQGCSISNMCIIDDDIDLDLAQVIPTFSHVTKDGITNYRSATSTKN